MPVFAGKFRVDSKTLNDIRTTADPVFAFILFPERTPPHFFFHYIIAKEVSDLSRLGSKVKIILLDTSYKILDSEFKNEDSEKFINTILDLIKVFGGDESKVEFLLERLIIEDKKMTKNIIKLLSSLSTDELIHISEKVNYGLINGFFDVASLLSLPEDQKIDFVVVGKHEKISAYLLSEKLKSFSSRRIGILTAPSIYYIKNGHVIPYEINGEKLFLSDSDRVLKEKVYSAKPSDIKTAIIPFLTNFLENDMAKDMLSDKTIRFYKEIDRLGDEQVKLVFYEFLSKFSRRFNEANGKIHKGMVVLDENSPGALLIFSALSNDIRMFIASRLKLRAMSLTELTKEARIKFKNNKLTPSHIYPHVKKLEACGLVKKENGTYCTTFSNIGLIIK